MKSLPVVLAAALFAAAPVAGSAFAETPYAEDVVMVVESRAELLDPETGPAAYSKLKREAMYACMRPGVKGVAAYDIACAKEMVETAMAELRAAAPQMAEAEQLAEAEQ